MGPLLPFRDNHYVHTNHGLSPHLLPKSMLHAGLAQGIHCSVVAASDGEDMSLLKQKMRQNSCVYSIW